MRRDPEQVVLHPAIIVVLTLAGCGVGWVSLSALLRVSDFFGWHWRKFVNLHGFELGTRTFLSLMDIALLVMPAVGSLLLIATVRRVASRMLIMRRPKGDVTRDISLNEVQELLAAELRGELAGTALIEACTTIAYELQHSSAAGLVPHEVWHYLSDADIRVKDPAYAVVQLERVRALLSLSSNPNDEERG